MKRSGAFASGILLRNSLTGLLPDSRSGKMIILLVSGWQDINIGDIAHTPGLLHIFNTFIPEAHIILWKRSPVSEVDTLIKLNFPEVEIIHGTPDNKGVTDDNTIHDAFERAHIMVHGSGPSIVGKVHLLAWTRYTNKPFGIFGTTIQSVDTSLKELLVKSRFIFTRETASIKVLSEAGIEGPRILFVPDSTFFLNLKNERQAALFLMAHSLERGRYICVIPRLRRTPYYKVNPASYTPQQIKEIDELNNSKKETDHKKMREAIITWVRKTGNKVLICPEMTYEVDIMDELLIDPLPDDVKPFVVKRGYWYPDEAASVYEKAFAVLSFECHSPIISIRNGTPAFYLRQPEDTIKGQMYYDLGLSDWIFEIEQTEGKQVADRLMDIYSDQRQAKNMLKDVHKIVSDYYKKGTNILKSV